MISAKLQTAKISVADIVISITADNNCQLKISDPYLPFITSSAAKVTLKLHNDSDLSLPTTADKEIFSAADNWQIFKRNGSYVITTVTQEAVLEEGFKSGDVYIKKEDNNRGGLFIGYPLDELLWINLLSRGRGTMFHSCGIEYEENGLLFVGVSGAGKSTVANLWQKNNAARILCDDRNIVRKTGSKFYVYGTPWHGDVKRCSAAKAPLKMLFFLNQAKTNRIKKLSPVDTFERLLVHSFCPLWDKSATQFILDFCADLSQDITSYEFDFFPDNSAIDFIISKI